DPCVFGDRCVDGLAQLRMRGGHAIDGSIVQPGGAALAAMGTQGGEGNGYGHRLLQGAGRGTLAYRAGGARRTALWPLLSRSLRRMTGWICAEFSMISANR